jgi:hypothetical protein
MGALRPVIQVKHAQTHEWTQSNDDVDWARYRKCWRTESYDSGDIELLDSYWRERDFQDDNYYAESAATFDVEEEADEWRFSLRSSMTCKPSGENDWWGWGRCYDSDRPNFAFKHKTDYGPPCEDW